MFDQLRQDAVRAINVRNPQAHKDELEIVKLKGGEYQIIDRGYEDRPVIFQGFKGQCEAFLVGMAYGGKVATADFASAF